MNKLSRSTRQNTGILSFVLLFLFILQLLSNRVVFASGGWEKTGADQYKIMYYVRQSNNEQNMVDVVLKHGKLPEGWKVNESINLPYVIAYRYETSYFPRQELEVYVTSHMNISSTTSFTPWEEFPKDKIMLGAYDSVRAVSIGDKPAFVWTEKETYGSEGYLRLKMVFQIHLKSIRIKSPSAGYWHTHILQIDSDTSFRQHAVPPHRDVRLDDPRVIEPYVKIMTDEINRIVSTFNVSWNEYSKTAGTPAESESPDTSGSIPWTTVVGGLAAVVAAAAALAALARKKSGGKKDENDKDDKDSKDDIIGYILQLSHDHLKLKIGEAVSFKATAWQVDSKGGYKPATDASVQVSLPPDISCVSVNPESASGTLNCSIIQSEPAKVESSNLTVTALTKKSQSTAQVKLSLGQKPELEVSITQVNLLVASGKSQTIDVWVENGGEDPWEFTAKWEGESIPVNTDIRDVMNRQAELILTEAASKKTESSSSNGVVYESTLVILAVQDKTRLERHINVLVCEEGLFILENRFDKTDEGAFRIIADGEKNPLVLQLRALAWDQDKKRLDNKPELLEPDQLKLLEQPVEDEKTKNAMEVGQLKFVMQSSTPAFTVYHLYIERDIPGGGLNLRVPVNISVSSRSEASFTKEIVLSVVTTRMSPLDREQEIELCQYIIDKYVPDAYKDKMQEILDKRAPVLGPEGLYELRRKIWNIAQLLTLGEGGQGYLDEAKWANRILGVLEWAQWAGDHCFNALVKAKLGPAGAKMAPFIKGMMIDAINAFIHEGLTPDVWLQRYIDQIMNSLNFTNLLKAGAEEGWKLFLEEVKKQDVVIYGSNWRVVIPGWLAVKGLQSIKKFATVWIYQGKSIYEAAKQTAWDQADEVIGDYLKELVGKKGDKSVSQVISEEISGDRKKSVAQNTYESTKEDLEIARNRSGWAPEEGDEPRKVQPPPEIPEPVIYDKNKGKKEGGGDGDADADADADGKKSDPPSDDGEVKTDDPEKQKMSAADRVRNCTKERDGKLYADKDEVVKIMESPEAVRTLKEAPREVQEAFENTRQEIYKEHDQRLTEWVEQNVSMAKGQKIVIDDFRTPGAEGSDLGTDRDYRVCIEVINPDTGKTMRIEIPRSEWLDESCKIFSEETGGPTDSVESSTNRAKGLQQLGTDQYHIEASQEFADQETIVDEKGNIRKVQVEPNIIAVKKGEADLKDAWGIGKMYETKTRDALEAGHKGEAYVQSRKCVRQIQDVRSGYEKRGYNIGKLPDNMQEGFQVIEEAAANFNDPDAIARADAQLKDLGYDNHEEFLEKISGQFDSLKIARKKAE